MSRYQLQAADPFQKFAWAHCHAELKMGHTATLLGEVDCTAMQALRRAAPPAARPSYTAFVVWALALVLKENPWANRRLTRHPWLPFMPVRVQQFASSDVMVAVEKTIAGDRPAVLLDVIRDAECRSLLEINTRLRELHAADETRNERWRTFKGMLERWPSALVSWVAELPLRHPSLWSKYRGGAASVSAPCKYGGDAIVAMWPASLGVSFGVVKDRPVVRNGQVVARPTFTLTLNFDRRLMPGAPAARLFQRLVHLLEDPRTERGSEHSPAACRQDAPEPMEVGR